MGENSSSSSSSMQQQQQQQQQQKHCSLCRCPSSFSLSPSFPPSLPSLFPLLQGTPATTSGHAHAACSRGACKPPAVTRAPSSSSTSRRLRGGMPHTQAGERERERERSTCGEIQPQRARERYCTPPDPQRRFCMQRFRAYGMWLGIPVPSRCMSSNIVHVNGG